MTTICKSILFLLFSATLPAATTAWVENVSNQQIIVRINTTNPISACTLTAIETVSGNIPDDVNLAWFPGATSCNRETSVVEGESIGFVLGLRHSPAISSVGSDGLIKNRSLFANTLYTITITSGSDSPIVLNAATANISLGKTDTESSPFCPTGFGNWCWPTIDWNDQKKLYADPESGLKLKRVTFPGVLGQQSVLSNFNYAIGGSGWVNPQNILVGSGCTDGASNCGETSNGNPIFIAAGGENSVCMSGYSVTVTCDDVLVALTGIASKPLTICISFYDSGHTCNSFNQTITLSESYTTVGFPAAGPTWSCTPATCNGPGDGSATWSPQFQFGEWGGTAPKQGDFGNAYGRSNLGTGLIASGTSIVVTCPNNNQSQSCFNPKWNNSYLHVVGATTCAGPNGEIDICQLFGHPLDTEHATLTTPTGCASPCDWDSLASGFLITPNGGTVDIGAQYSYASSAMFHLPIEGYPSPCNSGPKLSVGFEADGITPINPPVEGEFCIFQQQNNPYTPLFLIIPSTGETRYISPMWTPRGVDAAQDQNIIDQNGGQIFFGESPWDQATPNCLFGYALTNPNTQSGSNALFKACYDLTKNFKAYSHPLWPCGTCADGSIFPGQDPATYWYPGARWPDDPMIYTDITPPSLGLDPASQAAKNNPNYLSSLWPKFILDKVARGYAVFAGVTPNQGVPTTFISINTSTGLYGFYGDSFFTYPFRFGQFHSSQASPASIGYYGVVLNYLDFANSNFNLGGPFTATPTYVYFQGTPSSNTTLGTCLTTGPCESCSQYTMASNMMSLISLYGDENQCMRIRMPNVISRTPSLVEATQWPTGNKTGLPAQCSPASSCSEPTILAAGDELALPNEDAFVASVAEVTDSYCPSGCLDVIVVRGTPIWGGSPTTEPNEWSVQAGPPLGACNIGGGCTPGTGAFVAMNTTGNMATGAYISPHFFGGHSDAGVGLSHGNMTFSQAGIGPLTSGPYSLAYSVLFNKSTPGIFGSLSDATRFGATASFGGIVGSITIQSYPSGEQWTSLIPAELKWILDYHHMSPSDGTGSEEFIKIDPITYSLVPGTSMVYSVTAPPGGLIINESTYKLFGIQGWAGYNLLQDVSGPTCTINASTPYVMGFVLNAGECVTGSLAGQLYMAVPNVPNVLGNCVSNWLVESYPCLVFSMPHVAGALVQHDASFSYAKFEGGRVLTKGLSGYGRQYEFNTFIPDPTGGLAFFKTDWTDGIRSEIFMAELPPFPTVSSSRGSNFVNLAIPFSCTGYAEAQFGYLENGSTTNYFATPRQDITDTSGFPFRFESVDSRTLHACSSPLNIPGLSQHVVYYRLGSSLDGINWTYGPNKVGMIP